MSRRREETGAATAELAVALPLLLAVTVGLVWLLRRRGSTATPPTPGPG